MALIKITVFLRVDGCLTWAGLYSISGPCEEILDDGLGSSNRSTALNLSIIPGLPLEPLPSRISLALVGAIERNSLGSE
jgi:hypothetical protein